jgi:hypothetical protein
MCYAALSVPVRSALRQQCAKSCVPNTGMVLRSDTDSIDYRPAYRCIGFGNTGAISRLYDWTNVSA